MRSIILITLAVLLPIVIASNVPSGFIPLPPLPVKTNPPVITQKPKPTKKPTMPPKPKPTTKPTPPSTTTLKSTLAPSSKLPPSSTILLPTSKPNCGLNINLPNTNCNSGGNSAVQQTLSTLKQQLDKTRQQNQAQNTALQSMVTQLQTQQAGYLTKIADLQNEVRNLVSAFNSLSGQGPISTPPTTATSSGSSSSNNNNPFLQQAVQNVRQDLRTAISTFNLEIFNLSSQLQSSTQQELKIQQSIEAQIQQQATDVGRLSQEVKDLERLLQQVNNTKSSNTPNGATSADIAKLKAQISKVENDIQQYSASQQKQFSNLTAMTGSLQAEVGNHSNSINGLKTTLLIAQGKISKVEADETVLHDALAQLRKSVLPRLNQIESDIKTLKSDVASAKSGIGNIGKSVMNLVVQSGTDGQKLKGLDAQTTVLKATVQSIQGDLNSQKTEIASLKSGMVNLKNSVPINELNDMNNIILTIMQNTTAITQTQLQSLTQAITKITSKLSNLSVPGPSSG